MLRIRTVRGTADAVRYNKITKEPEPGPIWSGFGNAEIDMTKLKDNSNITTDAVFWYHSHPSGTVDVDEVNFNYINPNY